MKRPWHISTQYPNGHGHPDVFNLSVHAVEHGQGFKGIIKRFNRIKYGKNRFDSRTMQAYTGRKDKEDNQGFLQGYTV